MKKLSFTLLGIFLWAISSQAQQLKIDTRFGKISDAELKLESYDKVPDAEAVILYEDVYTSYDLMSDIKLVYDYRVRIKVLKPEGTSAADVSIGYRESTGTKETISGLDAVAYNLEDGKIVKTPLKKQYIFREETSEIGRLLKFSIPEVKAGTVIEYRYRRTSDYYFDIPAFNFQHAIPVMQGMYEAALPEFFKFNIGMKGYQPVAHSEKSSSQTLGSGPSNSYTYSIRHLICKTADMPALKSEPFVWCLDDYRSALEFELSQIAMPFTLVQNFTTSWDDVNNMLGKSTFDTHTRIGNPFKEEVAAIVALKGTAPETARAILKMVQSKIKWNETYNLISKGPRAALSKGSGSSADINFLLMAALKDADFKVTPILLNPRQHGRLPYTRATIDGIHTFILRVAMEGSDDVYMDGTNPYSDLNILPSDLLVDRARAYGINGNMGWCDLTNISQSFCNANMTLTLHEDNTLTGQVIESYINQEALSFSTRYTQSKDQEEFIQEQAKENDIEMSDVKIEGVGTQQIQQSYTMTQRPNSTDEYVYLNATCLPFMSTNQLNAQTRLLPVEFSYPDIYQIRFTINFPEGYTVEEMPKSINMAVCENGMRCRYIVQQVGNNIQAVFTFTRSRIIYPATEYADLSTFYGLVTDLSNSKFVIKKK